MIEVLLLFGLFTYPILLFFPKAKWLVLSFTVYLSSMETTGIQGLDNHLIRPLETLRNLSRPISVGCLLALFLFFFLKNKKMTRNVFAPVILFFFLQFYINFLELFRGNESDSLIRLILNFLLFLVFAMNLPSWIQSGENMRDLIRSFVGSGIIFLLFSSTQLFLNPTAIIWQGRLFGTTGSPQHAAVILALLILPCHWMAKTASGRLKPIIWYLIETLFFIFLIWTGSRTGFVMLFIAFIFYFHRNLRLITQIIIISTILAIYVVTLVYPNFSTALTHIFSAQDTRSSHWSNLMNTFLSKPAFGAPLDEIKESVSSYLLIAARGGFFGLVLVTLLAFSALKTSYRGLRQTTGDPHMINLAQMIFASFIAYFIGAIFEGYILSNLAFPIFAFYIFCVIQQKLLKRQYTLNQNTDFKRNHK